MEESKMRYLEMIQEVINRMANNSFALKGWTVTLVAGIFTLSGDTIGTNFWFLFIPIIIFWGLDAYYLSKERSYRALYKHVTGLSQNQIDFNMDTRAFSGIKKNKLWNCLISPTELLFYLPLSALSGMIIFIIT
ncbi:MAG: hypothetical protein K2M46_07095 [Lachnospiraceae bacterium]|nr:hypothetical protein [Lachnospiraceae bacterium]